MADRRSAATKAQAGVKSGGISASTPSSSQTSASKAAAAVQTQQANKNLSQKDLALKYGGKYSEGGKTYTVGAPTAGGQQGRAISITIPETLKFSEGAEVTRKSETNDGGISTVKTTKYQYDDEGEVVGVKQQGQSNQQRYAAAQPQESPEKTFDRSNIQGGRDIGIELSERMGFLVSDDSYDGSSKFAYDEYGEVSSPKLNKVKGSKQTTEQIITPSLLYEENNYLGIKGASPKFVNEKGEPMIQAYTSTLGITTSIGESQNIPQPKLTKPKTKESPLDSLMGKNISVERQYETMKAGLSGAYKTGVEVVAVGVASLESLSSPPNFRTSPAKEVVQSKKISATERGTIKAEKFVESANIPKYAEGSLQAKEQFQGELGGNLLLFSGVNAVGEAGAGVISKIGAKGVRQAAAESLYAAKSESSQLKIVQDVAKRVQKENPNAIIGIERLTEAKKGVGVQYQITIGTEGRQATEKATSEYKGQNILDTPEGELFGKTKFAKPTETPLESIITVERKTDLFGIMSVSAKESKIPSQVISSAKGEASKGESLIIEFTPTKNYGFASITEVKAGSRPPSVYLTSKPSDVVISGKVGKGTQKALNLQGLGKEYSPNIIEDNLLMRSFKEEKFNEQLKTARTAMEKGDYFAFTTKEGLTTQGQKILEGAKQAGEYKQSYYGTKLPLKAYLEGDTNVLEAFRKGTTHKASFTEFGSTRIEKGVKEFTGIKNIKEETPTDKMRGFDKKTGMGKYPSGKSKAETITVKSEPEWKQFSTLLGEKAKLIKSAEKEILFTDPRFKETTSLTGIFIPTGHEVKLSKKDESQDILFSKKRFDEKKKKRYGEEITQGGETGFPEIYGNVVISPQDKLHDDIKDALRIKVGRGTSEKEKLGFSDKLSWSVTPAIAQGLIPTQITTTPQKTITPTKQGTNLEISMVEKLGLRDIQVTTPRHRLDITLEEKLKFDEGFDPILTKPKEPIKEPPPLPLIPTGFWSMSDQDVPSKDLGSTKGFFGNVPIESIEGIYGKKADITYSEGSGFHALTKKGKVKQTKKETYSQGLTVRSYKYEQGRPQIKSKKYSKLGGGILSSIGGKSNLRSRKGNKYKQFW